jgi:hypothetical protein
VKVLKVTIYKDMGLLDMIIWRLKIAMLIGI